MKKSDQNSKHQKIREGTHLRVAYIIGAYPLLTTTFIDREIKLLRKRGVELNILSIRRPSGILSPEQENLQRDVTYLLPVSLFALLTAHLWFALQYPVVYWKTFFYLFTRPHPNLKTRLMTVLHFGEGVYAAYLLMEWNLDQVHAHFVDRAATIALIISRLLNIPYSATAHANDIFVKPILLAEKVAGAKFVATCTNYNKTYLESMAGIKTKGKLHRIYHGLDIQQYQPSHQSLSKKPVLVSVGQLKEKKGFTYLISACKLLKDRGYDFRCEIIGEGPLRSVLEEQIHRDGLDDDIVLLGAQPHEVVIKKYQSGTVFVLPCILSADGDRDGIPNVILEALAMELPVISTHHSGIPEVVEDGFNGLLVPPTEPQPLSDALAALLDDPMSRISFGRNGRMKIKELFSVESNVDKLLKEFLV
jgi:glycosyltransferase involved in cell wall biosynthesis